jgi:hypothetical protein
MMLAIGVCYDIILAPGINPVHELGYGVRKFQNV